MGKVAGKRTQPARAAKAEETPAASTSKAPAKPPAKKAKKDSAPTNSAEAKAAEVPAKEEASYESSSDSDSDIERGETNNDFFSIETSWVLPIGQETYLSPKGEKTKKIKGIGADKVEELKGMFSNKSTDCLVIGLYDGPVNGDALTFYSTIFATLKYDILEINFKAPADFSDFLLSFLPVIFAGRDLSHIELKLTWMCTMPQNLPKLRQAMLLVPKVRELNIEYCIKKDRNDSGVWGEVFDDATLAHLVTCPREDSKLNNAACVTAEGVIAAFDAFCESDAESIMVHVKESVVKEVFRLAARMNGKYGSDVEEDYELRNEAARKTLGADPGDGGDEHTAVEMTKDRDHPRPTFAERRLYGFMGAFM